ncbi:hypothetical protein ANO14919_104840 [Xylariales sp. No.14919]|nr:hypothetical protein ANO14919_104840 [Xylariales sp. No.14919]
MPCSGGRFEGGFDDPKCCGLQIVLGIAFDACSTPPHYTSYTNMSDFENDCAEDEDRRAVCCKIEVPGYTQRICKPVGE